MTHSAVAQAQPHRAPRAGRWPVLLMAISSCLGGAAVSAAYQLLSRQPPRESQELLRDTPNVITAIRDLAVLEGASFHIERVIDLRDRQTRLFGVVQTEDALLLVAAGDVVAGVDLSSMRDGDIRVDPVKKRVSLSLPPVNVLSARLDSQRTYVHSRKTDTLAERSESLETRARMEAENTLREAALSAGILARAQKNTQTTLAALLRSLGFQGVEITFRRE